MCPFLRSFDLVMMTKTASKVRLSTATLDFLRDLAQHNNRDWFQANHARYDAAKAEFEAFITRVLHHINTTQPLGTTTAKDCIFRINRDVRFSKDKSPYKLNLAAGIGVGGRSSGRIDYYFHLQPNGETFIGAGMYQPTPAELATFRQEIDYNADALKAIIEADDFTAYFPEISGETLKTTPKGYSADHPEIALLKRKQLFFSHHYTDKEVVGPNFADELARGCGLIKPYCDFLNELFYAEHDETPVL